MHDPNTQAFHNRFFTIWHVDPETDGSDDSCGWSRPKAGNHREKVQKLANEEYDFYFHKYRTINLDKATCYEVIYAIWRDIRWRIYRSRVTAPELVEISDLASNPNDNLRSLVYSAKCEKDEFVRLWFCIYRCQARFHRKWYQHPKWHIRHWRIQFHFGRKIRFALGRAMGGGY